ncbi:hypothetical protein PVK06_012706 [Gossypium arboreum]|uniref:Uncharacterized protein n=1 Tax=Gossypium arboreum TaxID=29729 RepID=A0ABR0QCZ7_GOSAR|nr:hypothetical protein PVK06_012706 [Gossypium arboreum]
MSRHRPLKRCNIVQAERHRDVRFLFAILSFNHCVLSSVIPAQTVVGRARDCLRVKIELDEKTSTIKVNDEKVKSMWDKRLTEISFDICIKEILKGNRPGEDTGLGCNPIKGIVDVSDDWWESKLKVVLEAQKFRTLDIDPEFEGKLDQMFMGIVATSDKAWSPSLGTLPSEFFEDVGNDILEENEEENTINDVHISSQVGHDFDGNNKKKKKNLR